MPQSSLMPSSFGALHQGDEIVEMPLHAVDIELNLIGAETFAFLDHGGKERRGR